MQKYRSGVCVSLLKCICFFMFITVYCLMVTVFKCSAFLPYDAMRVYACYMSVCHKLAHTKITKCRITQTMPYDIPGTLVF